MTELSPKLNVPLIPLKSIFPTMPLLAVNLPHAL
ncbi:hypothetical protein MC5_04695 [Rickettsia australis str. Cutlack]|uniref:Uncharacterized protein n=1 Tax=Rickettsia australis (strain Cutlack) TaxID=1105110 RepID=H8K7J4_RICAC|nr:hypothetical protein MC5_04695 [Rickettsia australis str. Cutlack]